LAFEFYLLYGSGYSLGEWFVSEFFKFILSDKCRDFFILFLAILLIIMPLKDKDTLEDFVLMTELMHTGVDPVYHAFEVVYLLAIFSIDFLLGSCLGFL